MCKSKSNIFQWLVIFKFVAYRGLSDV